MSCPESKFLPFLSFLSLNPAEIQQLALHLRGEETFTDDQIARVVAATTAPTATTATTTPTAGAGAGAVVVAAEEKPKPKRKAKTVPAEVPAPVAVPVAVPVEVAVEVAAPVAEEKEKPKRKAKTAPAPATATATAPAPAVASADDPMRAHPSRLQVIDHEKCMGRKIDLENPLAGTRKGDAGANGQFFPEKQCSKNPQPGKKLCAICEKKDGAVKADPTVKDRTWYGRLDEPLFWNAFVVGCAHFMDKYPKGLSGDAPVVPAAAAAPAPAAAAAAAAAPAKKVRKTKAKVAVAADEDGEPAVNTIMDTSAPVSEVTEISFMYKGQPYVRDNKRNVYEIELSGSRKYVGAWVADAPGGGEIDEFGEEQD